MKRVFSTANLTMLSTWLFFILSLFYNNHWEIELTEKILFSASALCFAALAFHRFPLFVSSDKTDAIDKISYECEYIQKISWFKHFLYALLTLEKNDMISLFANSTLRLYTKRRICKFVWTKDKAKFIHRFCDVCFMLILLPIVFTLAQLLIQINIFSFVVLDFIILIALDRINLLMYSLSVNVEPGLNVVFPYSSSQAKIFRYYGIAFRKTVLITADTFRLNPVIKNYVVAHEMGHIKHNWISLVNRAILIFNLFFGTLTPYILYNFGIRNSIMFFVLGMLILFYAMISRFITEHDEFMADKFAVESIGKSCCLEALSLLKSEERTSNLSLFEKIFVRNITFSRRIKLINEYTQNETV